jgi:hypothetical protein
MYHFIFKESNTYNYIDNTEAYTNIRSRSYGTLLKMQIKIKNREKIGKLDDCL